VLDSRGVLLREKPVFLLGLERSFSDLDREVAMNTFKILAVGAIVSFFSFYVFASNQTSDMKAASCGHKTISIFFKVTADYLIACEGIERAKNFFASYGYAAVPGHRYRSTIVESLISAFVNIC
jgi:hypothetical protein